MERREKERRRNGNGNGNASPARHSVQLLNQLAAEKYIMGGK